MKTSFLRSTLSVAAILMPAAAQAHPGHELAGSPFLSGLLHPLTGMDHLCAMLLVGMWGGLVSVRKPWLIPGAFLGAMMIGFACALATKTGAGPAEAMIAVSVLMLGILVAFKVRAPLAASLTAAAVFGFAHGMAHGLEAPGQVGTLAFAAGFLATTAGLHVVGIQLSRRISGRWSSAVGGLGFALGLIGFVT
jgi:urease accessory protein